MNDTISREAVADAINGIECARHTTWYEFYQKVMTAVEKLPTAELSTNLASLGTDAISRQTAISAICNACGKIDCDQVDKCEKLQLPTANNSETPNSSDTISRAKAIDALTEYGHGRAVYIGVDTAVGCIEHLPPAQPERIRGRWIETGKYFPNTHWQLVYEVVCDKCNGIAYLRKSDKAYIGANICPNCGAEMEVDDGPN